MRHLIVDPIRLLVRKALPQLIAFGCWPTRREFRAIARKVAVAHMREWMAGDDFKALVKQHAEQHETLH